VDESIGSMVLERVIHPDPREDRINWGGFDPMDLS
jgi:hypothetical protein